MRPFIFFIALSLMSTVGRAEVAEPVNKLLQMYRLYYLPFQIEFRQGRTVNDLFPMGPDSSGTFSKLLKPEDLKALDSDYALRRQSWKKKSLFLQTAVETGKHQVISQKLISHHIGLNHTALEGLSLDEKIQLNALLEGKSDAVKKSALQMRYLRSFIQPFQSEKFNFFIIGPSWCESTKEYRALIEEYAKRFADPKLIVHSVIIEDPNEAIFDSRLLAELFPHPEKYTHDNVPRFLAMETQNGVTTVWEEGEAVEMLVDRFFINERGFLETPTPSRQIASQPNLVDPVLSSATK